MHRGCVRLSGCAARFSRSRDSDLGLKSGAPQCREDIVLVVGTARFNTDLEDHIVEPQAEVMAGVKHFGDVRPRCSEHV